MVYVRNLNNGVENNIKNKMQLKRQEFFQQHTSAAKHTGEKLMLLIFIPHVDKPNYFSIATVLNTKY